MSSEASGVRGAARAARRRQQRIEGSTGPGPNVRDVQDVPAVLNGKKLTQAQYDALWTSVNGNRAERRKVQKAKHGNRAWAGVYSFPVRRSLYLAGEQRRAAA